MATMTPQQLMEALQASAGQQKTFADKLAENRLAKQGNIEKFQQQYGNTSYNSNGVALAPSQVMGGASALNQTYKEVLSPYSPELEQKARAQESDILSQIYQLQQKDQAMGAGETAKAPTISEKLAALKAGYTVDDQGNLTKADTTTANAEMVKTYTDQLKSGNIKLTDVPDDIKDAVIKELNAVPKIGKDEVQGVNLIDSILGKKTLSGVAGRLHGNVFNYATTQEARGELKQLNNILQLAASGKLKGQGAISEGERAILAGAVSSLQLDENGNSTLPDASLKAKLAELRSALAKQSNDPELIKKYGATTNQPGSQPAYNEDDIIKGVLGGK